MNIKVQLKDVYGQRRIYPACDTSKLLLSMSPTRLTFDERQIDTIKKLGYTIIIEAERL